MLDLNFVRDNLALVEEKVRQRGMNPAEVLKDFRAIDAERRQAITEAETMKARRNTLVEGFQRLKVEEKRLKSENRDTVVNDQTRTGNLAEQAELKKKIQSADKLAEELNAKLKDTLNGIPNLPHAVCQWALPRRKTLKSAAGARRRSSISSRSRIGNWANNWACWTWNGPRSFRGRGSRCTGGWGRDWSGRLRTSCCSAHARAWIHRGSASVYGEFGVHVWHGTTTQVRAGFVSGAAR